VLRASWNRSLRLSWVPARFTPVGDDRGEPIRFSRTRRPATDCCRSNRHFGASPRLSPERFFEACTDAGIYNGK
jgi:hypothetical protein